MPNWCSNSLVISGPEETLKEFLTVAETPHASKSVQFNNETKVWENVDVISTTLFWNFVNPTEGETNLVLDQYYTNESSNIGALNWYGWNIKNWGVKWDVDFNDIEVIDDDQANTLILQFSTAWTFPAEFLIAVSKQYPTLSFENEYVEEGMGFQGLIQFDNGTYTVIRDGECDHDWYLETYSVCPNADWDAGFDDCNCEAEAEMLDWKNDNDAELLREQSKGLI
jgi:hypothetical protein